MKQPDIKKLAGTFRQHERVQKLALAQCLLVNPDNPMAVAESIKEMYETLRALSLQFWAAVEHPYSKDKEIYEQAQQALAKVKSKGDNQ